MAVSAATLLSDFSNYLNRNVGSTPVFERVARKSVVQRLVPQYPLGINGESIPVVTGTLTAGWVSEAGAKPASNAAVSLKTMDPKKLAVIAIVSAEVARANPANYLDLIRQQVAEAFAVAFDKAALYDQGPDGGAGTGPFATYLAQTTNSVEIGTGDTIYDDFVSALDALVADDSDLNGWALDNRLEPLLYSAKDANDRPLFIDTVSNQSSVPAPGELRSGVMLARPAFMGRGVYSGTAADIEGFGGDWNQARWGVVGGINYSVSTEATATINGSLVSLWENNLIGIRAEAEYGFVMNDADSFVTLVNAS